MIRLRAFSLAAGIVFGFLLCWAGLSSPDAIRRMLLFQDWYLYPMFASAVATGFVGLRALRRRELRAVFTHDLVSWTTTRPQRRHVVGSVLFGAGWCVSDACPGPIATQLGFGAVWSLCTAVGVVAGIAYYLRRQDARAAVTADPVVDAL